MRRPVIVLPCLFTVLLVTGIDCTEKLLLPARGLDGGGNEDAGNFGSGGSGISRDGSFGPGGRGGLAGAGAGGGRTGVTCPTSVKLPPLKTRLVFSVGKNSSMTRPFGNNGTTRLGAVQQALEWVIADNFNAVNFGYQDFPGIRACPTGLGCCSGSFIPPDSTTRSAIQGQLQCGQPGFMRGCATSTDSRPIGAALQAALSLVTASDGADHQLVLLVDGDPSCSSVDPIQTCEAAKVARAQLRTLGLVTTFVVGVGQDAATSSCLAELALEGDHPLVTANDPPELNDIIRGIVNMAAAPSCIISLMPTVDHSTVRLFLGGDEVTPLGPEGWEIVDGPVLKIQVKGSACRRLQRTPEHQVQVLGCLS
jgi:hypothetical protein